MNHEHEQSRTNSTSADFAHSHDDTVEPGQSSRSARLRKSDRAIASGLMQRKARDANGVSDGAEHAVGTASSSSGSPLPDATARVHAAAAQGVAGPGEGLPHLNLIQRAFGPQHDLSGVLAHVGGDAAAACDEIGANAYATGNHVAFRDAADLHTVAHEATHVIQQRGGVQLLDGVGAAGDPHERQADQVADLVVRGESAAPLLGDGPASTASPAAGGVQRDGGGVRRQERPAAESDRDPVFELLGADWAGVMILQHYLHGEGADWDISDPLWADYMMRNQVLPPQILPRIQHIATERFAFDAARDRVAVPIRQQFAALLENGEGLNGYNFLHGTAAEVGGFVLSSNSTVSRGRGGESNLDGSTTPGETIIEIQANYRWNDMMDPNPRYISDRLKSLGADIVTRGHAQSYRISISWTSTARVHLDAAGHVTRVEGWPGQQACF
jgi:hypothetical protein